MRLVVASAIGLTILLFASARSDARVWVVDQRKPSASDSAAATPAAPYRTISRAAEQALPGDTVLVREGVYRERVAPEKSGLPGKPVVYRAAPGEVVIIKGSDVWSPEWKPVKGSPSVSTGRLDPALFTRTSAGRTLADYNPFRVRRYVNDTNLTLGQVFVDGEPLQEVSRLQDVTPRPGTWMAGRTGAELYINLPPRSRPIDKCVVEITTRGRVFAPYKRGISYIVVQGFVMEHCGNQYPEDFYGKGPAQAGLVGCRGGNHWIIENNVIRFAKTTGIDCGAEGGEDTDGLKQRQLRRSGYQIIRNNDISDNGAAGIIGENVPGTLILGNRIERNNREGFYGMEGGGIKVHALNDGLIEGNLIRDNGICGLWLDNGASHTRVTRNVVVNNTGAGIFMELGSGPTFIDNNIIAFTTCGGGLAGDGFYSHDACNVTLAHNLIYCNANFGVWSHLATDRMGNRPELNSGWRVVNNMIFGNHRGAVSMPPPMAATGNNLSDHNLITGAYDLVTEETWGTEYDRPLFLENTNKERFSLDSLVHRFRVAMDSAKVPDSLRPNLSLWKSVPLLTFEQWRQISGNDRHSRVPVLLRPNLSRHDLTLDFIISDDPMTLKCKPVVGIDRDFFGTPLTAGQILPGPFQKLVTEPALRDRVTNATPMRGPFEKLRAAPERTNRMVLWPIVPVNRPERLAAWEKSQLDDRKRTEPRKYPPGVLGSKANPASVPHAIDSVRVDADSVEWASVKSLPAPFEEKSAGLLRLRWRDEGVYGLVRVPTRRARMVLDAPWEGDCIELFVQKDNASPKAPDSATVHLFLVPVRGTDTCQVRVMRDTLLETVSTGFGRWKSNDKDAYVMEFFLPASLVTRGPMKAGVALGFGYSVIRRGEPLEQFFFHREFEESWKRPDRWGGVRLGK